jgi:hypothetical protein
MLCLVGQPYIERENSCMFASVATDVVAYGRKQHKDEVLIIRLIKEAWELLLSSANQVASNSFNGSYAGMSFIYSYCIIDEGNLGKNFLSQIYFIKSQYCII